MSALPIAATVFGGNLTEGDYRKLVARWITPECAVEAGLRRVDSFTGRDMFGRRKGDCAGIIIPNILPGENSVREYRIRLDHPELEFRTDGTIHEARKYLQPSSRPNLAYFPPGVSAPLLKDVNTPIVITEGEFKAIALWRASTHKTATPRFLPISVAGVWSFRGVVGKTIGPAGDRQDVKGVIPDFERIAWAGRKVIVAYDADTATNPKVIAARNQLGSVLIQRGATVGYLGWPLTEGKGIDDRLENLGPEAVIADIERVEFGDWRTRLLRNEAGKLLSGYENVALFLENHPDWSGVLGYNEFTGGYTALGQAPAPIAARPGSEIDDHFVTGTIRWLERHGLSAKPDLASRVVDMVAQKNSFHPVRDYLEGLPEWDGTPRVRSWLFDYCGVKTSDENPNRYAEAIGEKFLVSAVARIMEPGCKVDHALVLESPQGCGKSSAVRILAAGFSTDQIADLGSKDASMQLRGVWFAELSELDALNRSDIARVKAFLTQQTERFRLPYGRRVIDLPRQCVFIGTTNSDTWLKDETGGRRFWPVRCGLIDTVGLLRDRDQLWAEALHLYRSGVRWWLEDQLTVQDAIEEQRGRYVEDVWQPKIEQFIRFEENTSVCAVLSHLGVETARQDQSAANRVARTLQALGWQRFKKRTPDGKSVWLYRKAEL